LGRLRAADLVLPHADDLGRLKLSTVNEQRTPGQRRADQLRAQDGASWAKEVEALAELTDEELVGHMQHRGRHEIGIPVEMSRRVIVSNGELRRAIDQFRDSAEESSNRLETLTRWLVGFTVALVVLTLGLVALTVVLIVYHP
jgi:hypothetical protein